MFTQPLAVLIFFEQVLMEVSVVIIAETALFSFSGPEPTAFFSFFKPLLKAFIFRYFPITPVEAQRTEPSASPNSFSVSEHCFTSGTGSEVQMGAAEGKSMLYLEALCIMVTKGAGVQGLQNGSISCIGVPGAVPSGLRAIAAENLITMSLDLEVASGNDQTF